MRQIKEQTKEIYYLMGLKIKKMTMMILFLNKIIRKMILLSMLEIVELVNKNIAVKRVRSQTCQQ